MLEQDEHFKHFFDNPTYWGEVDGLIDWLIEKNRSGYQMVNSLPRLQEMKAFLRMSCGLDLGKTGSYGDGASGNGHQSELLTGMPGIQQERNGEFRLLNGVAVPDRTTWSFAPTAPSRLASRCIPPLLTGAISIIRNLIRSS